MKTKIKRLIAFVILSGASLTVLFALPNTPPTANPQTGAEVTVPSMVSTSTDNGGMRTLAETIVPSVRYGSHIDLNRPSLTLESLDVRSLTLQEPNQIGVNRSVAVSPDTGAQEFVNPDGSRTVVLIIKSSGASGIGVHFRNFALDDGEEVYVYGTAPDSIVSGPYTNEGPWGSGEFWSATLVGDTAIIEFHTRTDKEQGFEIFEISHILPELDWRLQSDQPDILGCEVDASCFGDAEKNAVGRIIFNDNGAHVCVGTLLNNVAQDHTPYFLTAHHCVETQAVAQSVEVFWFYRTTNCNSGVLRNWVHSPPGANLLATQRSNDFSLLRLQNSAPAGAVFSGWTSAPQGVGTGVRGLHHPGGFIPPDVPSYLRRAAGSITDTNVSCADSGVISGYRINWSSGTAEGGSSGSGLWNSNGHLVGVLSCGPDPSTCTNPRALYSKFANFYPQIRPYIGSGTPVASPSDFNNDAHPDYLLYNAGTNQTGVWFLDNNVLIGTAFGPTLPSGWQSVGVGDFNRDSHPDYLLFNSSTRETVIWYLSGVIRIAANHGPTLPSGWSVVAIADFNADGYPDLVLYKADTRQTVVWFMRNNVRVTGSSGPTLPAGWALAGAADFNGNGNPDYLLWNPSTRQTVIWYMSRTTRLNGRGGPTIAPGYELVGTADFDGSGRPDYLLYNSSTRQTAIWYLNNYQLVGSASGPTLPNGWTLVAP